jgi:hypothetical protein
MHAGVCFEVSCCLLSIENDSYVQACVDCYKFSSVNGMMLQMKATSYLKVLSQQVVREVSAAFVALPVGSYIVSLVVRDTSGRNASIAQVRPSLLEAGLCDSMMLVCALLCVLLKMSCRCKHSSSCRGGRRLAAASTQWDCSDALMANPC